MLRLHASMGGGQTNWYKMNIASWKDLENDQSWMALSEATSNHCEYKVSIMSWGSNLNDRFLRCSTSANGYLTDGTTNLYHFHYREVGSSRIDGGDDWKKMANYQYNVFVRDSTAQGGGGASAFVPAECASSVPAGWHLSVPGACYIKYASTNSDGTTRTCDAGHTYFYISAQCMIDLGYTDGGTDSDSFQGTYALTVTHHAYSAVGSTSRNIKI